MTEQRADDLDEWDDFPFVDEADFGVCACCGWPHDECVCSELEDAAASAACDAAHEEPPCAECGGWHVMRICPECHEIACSNCRCEREDDD